MNFDTKYFRYRGHQDIAFKVLKTEGNAIEPNPKSTIAKQLKLPSSKRTPTELPKYFMSPAKPLVLAPALHKYRIKSLLQEEQLRKVLPNREESRDILMNMQTFRKKPPSPMPKNEKILDLLCLSTQQLKEVFAQPATTRKRIKVAKTNSIPKDFFFAS